MSQLTVPAVSAQQPVLSYPSGLEAWADTHCSQCESPTEGTRFCGERLIVCPDCFERAIREASSQMSKPLPASRSIGYTIREDLEYAEFAAANEWPDDQF